MADNKQGRKPRTTTTIVVLSLIAISALSAWSIGQESGQVSVGYGRFKQILNAPGATLRNVRIGRNDIRADIVTRDQFSGFLADGRSDSLRTTPLRVVRVAGDDTLLSRFDTQLGGDYQIEEDSPIRAAAQFAFYLIAIVATGLIALLSMRRIMGGNSTPFAFGRSKHKVYVHSDAARLTFADVAGIEEAKAELREVVDFLKTPERFQSLGGRIPRGVLLVGPPGTGKTMLARSVAGEADVPFFSISGSDFVELFAGVGASRVRDLFREAESRAPCIIFIDELDAMGKARSGNGAGSHEEREQTLNQLLVEMDGFDTNRGVIMMAATTRPEILDAALLRPGRFDRTVVVDRPDIEGREAILQVHARSIVMGTDIDLRKVAALTPGTAGADLANLVNEAALLAARRSRPAVSMADFDEAIERQSVGLERRSRIMRPEEKNRVAVHEAGHALVACAIPGSDPVHKVSIIPRGMAGGYVLQRPDGDRSLMTRSDLESRIKVALGGTIAEEVTFGEISTGATSDLQKANDIASRMVREFGMSRLGRIYLSSAEMNYLPGGTGGDGGVCSEATAREVDLEVRFIVDNCLNDVRHLLTDGRSTLDLIAALLVEKEVIDGPELLSLLTASSFEMSEAARKSLLEVAGSRG